MSHEIVEKKVGLMGVLIALVISVGGLVEIVPLYFQQAVTEPASFLYINPSIGKTFPLSEDLGLAVGLSAGYKSFSDQWNAGFKQGTGGAP